MKIVEKIKKRVAFLSKQVKENQKRHEDLGIKRSAITEKITPILKKSRVILWGVEKKKTFVQEIKKDFSKEKEQKILKLKKEILEDETEASQMREEVSHLKVEKKKISRLMIRARAKIKYDRLNISKLLILLKNK